jgi:serine/threonine-protein kinase
MGSRFGEGLPYLEKALAATMRTRGADDPFHSPQMQFSYGMALHNYGRWEDSLEQVSLAVDNRRKNRPGTLFLAQMLEQQASTLIELGHYTQAASALEEVLEIDKHAGQTPDLAWAAPQMHLEMVTGRLPEALALMEQYCGEPAPASLSFPYLRKLMIRADVLRTQGNFNEALRVARRLRSEILASPGRSYLRAWEMRSALVEGQASLGVGDPRRARPLLEHALELGHAMLHHKSAEIAGIQIALANCYLDLGRRDAARILADDARGILGTHRQLGDHLLVPMRKLLERVDPAGGKEIEGSTTR